MYGCIYCREIREKNAESYGNAIRGPLETMLCSTCERPAIVPVTSWLPEARVRSKLHSWYSEGFEVSSDSVAILRGG